MNIKKFCNECGSDQLLWHSAVVNLSSCQDGRLKLNEVEPMFFLSCENCSETVQRKTGEEIAYFLNKQCGFLNKL